MSIEHHSMQRLAFIRHLYKAAVTQSYAPSPMKCASVLALHDAVELFLQLAAERLNVASEKINFMDYWERIGPKLSPVELTQKESMRRLNKARVALKHHGTFPSDLDIEAFRATTSSFFGENTPSIFCVEFDSISLVEYVVPEISRALLREAEFDIASGSFEFALDKTAIAYEEMMLHRKKEKIDHNLYPPLYFNNRLDRNPLKTAEMKWGVSYDKYLVGCVDQLVDSIKSMQVVIDTLTLGIDYRKYSLFKQIVPSTVRTQDGKWHTRRQTTRSHSAFLEPNSENAAFCISFVIETALALSQSDNSMDFVVRPS